MNWKQIAVVMIALAVVAGGIYLVQVDAGKPRKKTAGAAGVKSPALTLYSGAGLRPAVRQLTDAFEKKHGISVETDYAGGGQLLGTIAAHQRGDLFMAGAERYADMAIERGLAVPETKKTVAYFVPVIFVGKGNPKNITSLEDFTRTGVRLGFGDERCCAVGEKTLKILEKNDIALGDVQPQVVYKSKTVNELGVAVQMGSVDAVVMWNTNARHYSKNGEIVRIPLEKNIVSAVPLVMLESTDAPQEAKKFIDFATSEEARSIWENQEYTVSLDKYRKNRPLQKTGSE